MSRARELAEIATAYDSGSPFGFRNRIINGQMMVDQRNAGASVSLSASTNYYPVDRFLVRIDTGSSNTTRQSTTAPSNYTNSALVTMGTGASPASGDFNIFSQRIEGFNMADFGWGTSTASTITLSFLVRSSVTGTFGISLRNSAVDRSYITSYTINSANTWEQKTVTIAGDTSGTWVTNNGVGCYLSWDLGVGSSNTSNTLNSWQAGSYVGYTSGTKFCATSGATFYITGVQLEKGSTATSFDYRPYGTELALCQRYYSSIALTAASGFSAFIDSTTAAIGYFAYPVTMRSTPVMSTSGTAGDYGIRRSGGALSTCSVVPVIDASSSANSARVNFTVASGLTAGQGCGLVCASTSTFLGFSSEL